MAKCHDCKWARVNDFDFEHYNRVGCVWHLENNYPATFGENIYPRVANNDLAEICEVYETRADELSRAPVRSEQNVAYCTGHVAPVVNGYCFECGLPRSPRSTRSEGG